MSVKRSAIFGAGIVLALSCAGQSAAAADVFTLASTTFEDGAMMPKKVANNTPGQPNCVGENISPQLSWTNVPAGTTSFVLEMDDVEGRAGAGVHHFVSYGIAPTVTGFAEGELGKPSDKFVGGKNSQGIGTWTGPCTPPNIKPHHYAFILIATDLDPKAWEPGLTREEVNAKVQGHSKGVAGLIGLFVKPAN
jgi:Raf kinase inhibitor-like YbhB/YbcL family protein